MQANLQPTFATEPSRGIVFYCSFLSPLVSCTKMLLMSRKGLWSILVGVMHSSSVSLELSFSLYFRLTPVVAQLWQFNIIIGSSSCWSHVHQEVLIKFKLSTVHLCENGERGIYGKSAGWHKVTRVSSIFVSCVICIKLYYSVDDYTFKCTVKSQLHAA